MNLYDVKAGDKIMMWSYRSWSVKEVARVTKTQVVIGEEYPIKFRKSDGYQVGTDYSRNSIKAVTPQELDEHIRRVEEEKQLNLLRREAAELVAQIQPRYMSKAEAEELICFLRNEWKQGI